MTGEAWRHTHGQTTKLKKKKSRKIKERTEERQEGNQGNLPLGKRRKLYGSETTNGKR